MLGHPGMIRDQILIRDLSLPVRRQPNKKVEILARLSNSFTRNSILATILKDKISTYNLKVLFHLAQCIQA